MSPFSMLRTARSVDGSVPSTSAWTEAPSPNLSVTLLLRPITWALVTIWPSASVRKPVPEPWPARTETTAGLALAYTAVARVWPLRGLSGSPDTAGSGSGVSSPTRK
jgi:hypothetical protein